VLVALCMLFIVQAIVLFVWVPGDEFDANKTLAIAGGVIATIVIGEILIRRAGRPAPVLPHAGSQPGRA
jgi:hypothetical protein